MKPTSQPKAEAELSRVGSLPSAQEQQAGHSGIQREEALTALVAAVRQRHGASTAAVLFYGSCLRSGDPAAGIADFYVLVDSYRAAGMGRIAALANRLLPPNVFYLETTLHGHTLRAKYAIVRTDQFIQGCRGEWILPYLWGRFAQPSQIAWSARADLGQLLEQCLVAARRVFLERCAAALSGRFSTAELWQEALLMSYRTELRAEQREKIRSLVQADPKYYARHTPAILGQLSWVQAVGSPEENTDHSAEMLMQCQQFELRPPHQRSAQRAWMGRRLLGKLTSVLRLFKSLFTFAGAVDYAVWKLQRHSGRRIEIPQWARRYPWLGGWLVLWRLLRSGILK